MVYEEEMNDNDEFYGMVVVILVMKIVVVVVVVAVAVVVVVVVVAVAVVVVVVQSPGWTDVNKSRAPWNFVLLSLTLAQAMKR